MRTASGRQASLLTPSQDPQALGFFWGLQGRGCRLSGWEEGLATKAPAFHQGRTPSWRSAQKADFLGAISTPTKREGQGKVGVFSGTGSRKRQPRGLGRFFQASLKVRGQKRPPLEFIDKRLSGGVPNSGLGCLSLPLHLLRKSWPTPKAQLFLPQIAFTPSTLSAQPENGEAPDPMPTPAALELGVDRGPALA